MFQVISPILTHTSLRIPYPYTTKYHSKKKTEQFCKCPQEIRIQIKAIHIAYQALYQFTV